jgi:hypothetical protein
MHLLCPLQPHQHGLPAVNSQLSKVLSTAWFSSRRAAYCMSLSCVEHTHPLVLSITHGLLLLPAATHGRGQQTAQDLATARSLW